MALKAILVDPTTMKALDTDIGLAGEMTLVTESYRTLMAQWATVNNGGAETETLIDCNDDEAIMILDMIVSSKTKAAGSSIVFRFTDGTDTYDLPAFESVEKTFEFQHAFAGGLKGWKAADFTVITDTAGQDVDTMVTYVRLKGNFVKSYNEWIAEK